MVALVALQDDEGDRTKNSEHFWGPAGPRRVPRVHPPRELEVVVVVEHLLLAARVDPPDPRRLREEDQRPRGHRLEDHVVDVADELQRARVQDELADLRGGGQEPLPEHEQAPRDRHAGQQDEDERQQLVAPRRTFDDVGVAALFDVRAHGRGQPAHHENQVASFAELDSDLDHPEQHGEEADRTPRQGDEPFLRANAEVVGDVVDRRGHGVDQLLGAHALGSRRHGPSVDLAEVLPPHQPDVQHGVVHVGPRVRLRHGVHGDDEEHLHDDIEP
mmetsp:Transcript_64808/g.198201  ORF Transcript_64808/g.198201 Transcript_64808/m.198201 type:complete len:274 (-) Transcript_64808:34-855(-)